MTSANDNSPSLPRMFGRYELLEVVGRGGMGVIHKARQQGLDRICAVKTLSDERFRDTASRDQLLKEARAAASLQHPNIVGIIDVGEAEGHLFFSMEHIEGLDLAGLTRKTALSAITIATYVKKVAEAIDYAHRKGVLHCDLKPANVIIDAHDEPRVTDFGLTQPACGPSDPAGNEMGAGSPNFMAPEQASTRFGPLSERTDVYGLGATLYYLLTDRPPSRGETFKHTLAAVVSLDPVRPRSLRPGVPLDLETICLKCLQKRPSKRYTSAREVAEELGRFLEGEPIHARPISVFALIGRKAQRHPWATGFAVATFCLLALVAAGSSLAAYHIEQARQSEWEQRRLVEARETQLRRELYAADLVRASEAYADGKFSEVHALLDTYQAPPSKGEPAGPDLRGWEWRYLKNAAQGDYNYDFKQDAPAATQVLAYGGQGVVALLRDGSLRRLDVAKLTSSVLRPGQGFTNDSGLLRLRSDGRRMAVSTSDLARTNTVLEVYAVPDFTRVSRLNYPAAISSIGFSPDGESILACAELNMAGKFHSHLVSITASGSRPLVKTEWATRRLLVPAFSDDGHLVALNNDDGSITIRNLETGAEHQLAGHDFEPGWSILVTSMRFDPQGKYLVTTGIDRTVRVWNAETGAAVSLFRGHGDAVFRAAFSPDRQSIASIGRDHAVRVWRMDTGSESQSLLGATDSMADILFTPDGQHLVTGDPESGVRVWPTAPTRRWQQVLPLPMDALWAEATSDGSAWWWVGTDRQWYLRGGEGAAPTKPKSGDTVHSRAYHAGRNLEAWVTTDLTLVLTERTSGRERRYPLGHNQLTPRVRMSGDGAYVAISFEQHGGLSTDEGPSFLAIYSADNGNLIREFPGPSFQPVFSADNRWVAAGNWSGGTRLYDLASGASRDLPAHVNQAIAFAFSPDNRWIATGGMDGMIQVTEVATGHSLPPIRTHTRGIGSLAYSRDQSRLVVGTIDGYIQFWDTTVWRNVGSLHGHQKLIASLVFRDPNTLVSVGLDQVRLWKTADFPAVPPNRQDGTVL
ncbi:MAG TPA: protein kinase [Candidatus Limnocylindria bacterium]|nr:protein kinase [Candidatus Limnocylindria bacterium]